METKVKVGDIMTRDFVSTNSQASLEEGVRKMLKQGVASLVLKDDGELKGLLTEKDVLLVLGEGEVSDLKKVKVGEIAKKKVATVEPSTTIYGALQKMSKHKTRWLPVLEDREVVGFLTLNDIVKIEPSLLEIFYS